MLKDGEKYACAACIRGHRVSSCQHSDRELHHINKKGRPVSQCHHCRGLRKSRAAHVKCDCGEHHHGHDGNGVTTDSKDDACPCMTGARCTCAFKKELSDVDETYKIHKPGHHKPAIANRRSDTAVPRARNGHHPPLHRQNNSAHQFGIPYPMKRLHSDDAGSDFPISSSYSPAYDLQSMGAPNQQMFPAFSPNSPHDTRLTRSAHASPILGPIPDIMDDPLSKDFPSEFDPPVPFSYLSNGAQFSNNPQRHSIHDFSQFSLDDLDYSTFGTQQPLSVNDELGADWSRFGIEPPSFDDANLPNPYRQAPSNASIDYSVSGRPGLSHSSSGTASEMGDPSFGEASFGDFPSQPINTNNNALRTLTLDAPYDLSNPSANPGANFGLGTSVPRGSLDAFGFDTLALPNMDLMSANDSGGGGGGISDALTGQPQTKMANGEPFGAAVSNTANNGPSFPSLAMPSNPEDEDEDEDDAVWAQDPPTFDSVFQDTTAPPTTQLQPGTYVENGGGMGDQPWI